MKKFAAIIFALTLLPAVTLAADNTGSATTSKSTLIPAAGGKISVMSGNVFIAAGKNVAHQAVQNEAIASGTAISTGTNSYAVLKFEDGQIVFMQANSTFLVREYRYEPKRTETNRIVFSMLKGGLRFVTGLIGQANKQAFRLSTPNATIGIRGTEFMVAMADKAMYSQVLTGNIGMTNVAGTVALGAGQTAQIASASSLATLIPASAIPAGTFNQLLSIPTTAAPAARPTASTPPANPPAPSIANRAPSPTLPATPISPVPTLASGAAVGGALIGIASVTSSNNSPKQAPPIAAITKPIEPAVAKPIVRKDDKLVAAAETKTKTNTAEKSKTGWGATGKIGTLGLGAELNYGLSDSFSTRVGLNTFSYNRNAKSSQINYDFKMQLQTLSALADWYPFSGGFRTSVGLLYDNNKISLSASPTGGTYIINGYSYTTADIGSLQGTMTFNKIAPYFGIGWGNPVSKGKGWGLVTDIGILFQGKPKIDLTVTCINASICSQLQTDATAENTKLQNDLSSFKFWPVASIGISYQW